MNFTQSITVYPILQYKDFYLLNAFFAQRRLMELKKASLVIAKDLKETWPPGQRVGNKATTRFDVPRQIYFNMTHLFFPDDFTNVEKQKLADQQDIRVDFLVFVSKCDLFFFVFVADNC